jgi:hypothetical protein
MVSLKLTNKIMAKKIIEGETKTSDVKEELTNLLKSKVGSIFEREPSAGFNGNLEKLVDEIINLF